MFLFRRESSRDEHLGAHFYSTDNMQQVLFYFVTSLNLEFYMPCNILLSIISKFTLMEIVVEKLVARN